MRRLVLLLSAVVAVDIMFFTALAPLLPHFAARYGLSKGGAGVLSAMYAAGVLAASLPGGLVASRLGPKPAALGGVLLTAAASLAFGLAGSVWTLGVARLLQGIGSAFSWSGALVWLVAAAPRERRGELIGATMGAAASGALLGPVLGAVASAAGVRATFLGVSALGVALSAWIVATSGVRPHPQALSSLRRADRGLTGGLWLVLLPAVLYGVVTVLMPLKLHRLGWGGVAIGALFLAGAALETVFSPLLGRVADRRGNLLPVRVALAASIAIALALAWAGTAALLAVLLLAAALAFNAFYIPGMALISSGAERQGIALGLVFGAMNGVWAAGNVMGPALGGALAETAGDTVPYLLLAVLCLLTLLATLPVAPAYLQARSRPRSP